MPFDGSDDDLFDAPTSRKAQPSNKIVFQPPNAQWSLDRVNELQKYYQSTYGKPLPLTNRGQGSIHNRWGYDHRNSADVSLNPSTPEGQNFTEYLKSQNIPFLAFTSAIPGVATGPHIHVGYPSKRTTQKFPVGAQQKGTQSPSNDLFDTKQDDSDLFDSQEPLKTPKVTSSVKELDSDEELPNVGRETSPKPIEFKAGTVDRAPASINPVENIYNALSDSTQQPRGLIGLQSRKFQTPSSQELGDWVKIPSGAKAPTEDDVIRGYLSTLGPEYVALGDKFKSDTGQNILSLRHGENIKQNEDGSYSIRPSRGATQFLNAYMKSPDEGMAEAERQRREYVQAENKAVQESKSQIERARRATEIEKQSPGYRGLFTAGAPVTQAAGTILGPLGSDLREGAAEMRAVGEQAEQEKPLKSLSTGEQLRYGAGALIPTIAKLAATKGFGAAQLPALGVLEGSTPQERLRGGLEGAAMQTALGPIPSQLGESLPSVARKTVAGTTLASIPTAQAIAQGEPIASAVIQNAPFALLPALEGKQSPERPTEIGIEKAPVVGVQGEATANIDQRLADREAKVQPTFLRDDQGNPVARVLNPDEAAQGEKIKIRPIHHSDTQSRDESGQFAGQLTPSAQPTERLNTPLSKEIPQRQTAVNPAQVPVEQAGAITSPLNATTPPPAEATGIPRSPESQVESARSAQDLTAQAAQSTPSTEAAENALPSQPNRVKFLEDKLHEMGADNASITNTSPERLAAINDTREELAKAKAEAIPEPPAQTPPSTTSARKAQVETDRAELDLPDLPQTERKTWRTSLINAKEKGLDQKAERLADQILRNPRPLDDEQTAGMVLKLQQLKNEHAQLMSEIDNASPETLADKRAELDTVEQSFDKISEAVRKSGTEKGRALASQKLTINQDFDLVSMLNRYKAKVGKEPTPEIRAQIEAQNKRIADLEKQLADAQVKPTVDKLDREIRRERRQITKKALDAEAATIKQNIAAEFARLKSQQSGVHSLWGLGSLDPEGVIARQTLKYVRNRVESGITDTAQLIDDVHGVLSEFVDGVTKRQVAELISGYNRPVQQTRSDLQKQIDALKVKMRQELRAQDIQAGTITEKRQGPPETRRTIERRYQKQIDELERRIREQDFSPKPKRGETVLDSETRKIQVQLERAKQDYQRNLIQWQDSQRSPAEKTADLLVNWARAAKLSYVSTLGKLSGAAMGRTVMSPLENLVGEIPHRLMPELSKKATTEGGGFSKAAEVAALWKSGRFRQVLDQLTKGSSDLDVLFGPQGRLIDKELQSRGGLLSIPGKVHGALKEFPRQAEFDRARLKVLRSYERDGKDITRPDVQLAANMEAFNSAERARFQQKNFISDTFNDAMNALERKGMAGKAASKAGRFIFPIVRVPVNVVGETLNYTFGLARAPIETAIRGGVKNLTPEQANNIMRAYKKGGIGLAVMTYAFLHPEQFGGYYQPNDRRKDNEAHVGEVMFFGHRIPKWATHVPILEAAQLAATSRRVMNKLAEKGESKPSAIFGGSVAAGSGLASQIPFYETPGRFREGAQSGDVAARLAGQQVKGMIPGFIQEGARALDKNDQGETVSRKRSGFTQEIQEGIPFLRNKLPESPTEKANFKDRLIENLRRGQNVDLDSAVESGRLTRADQKAIEKEVDLTPSQSAFDKAHPDKALDRYERMSPAQRRDVDDLMETKAWSLTHSDSLTNSQKEKFQERIDKLGIVPRDPRKRSFAPSFKTRFQSQLGAQ